MITIVTAPSRSGTSLTMQMLQAAGIPLMWNRLPNRTNINPYGHYELDRYKWDDEYARYILPQCEGKAVKIFSPNLKFLIPANYQLIFIDRDVESIRQSQRIMLEKENRPYELLECKNMGEQKEARLIENEKEWLINTVSRFCNLKLPFSELFDGRGPERIAEFLDLDALAVAKMNDCVDRALLHF